MGKPPALPGDSQSLTITGIIESLLFRGVAERFGCAERVQNIGRAFGVGSCAYSDFNPAQILGVASSRLH